VANLTCSLILYDVSMAVMQVHSIYHKLKSTLSADIILCMDIICEGQKRGGSSTPNRDT
jgi:hypothetical protein